MEQKFDLTSFAMNFLIPFKASINKKNRTGILNENKGCLWTHLLHESH